MYSGKTTEMLNEAAALAKLGLKVVYVKSTIDGRYSSQYIISHTGKAVLADLVVSSLTDVDIEEMDILVIDELHFFKNVGPALKSFSEKGIRILASTLLTGAWLERMPVWNSLNSLQLPLRIHEKKANCDVCGKTDAATTTARILPIGATWVGGKESYRSCCKDCFFKTSIFHNPTIALEDP
jgi:thymidine kinase